MVSCSGVVPGADSRTIVADADNAAIFRADQPLVLDLGCGNGLFLAALAFNHDGRVLFTGAHGIAWLDPATGAIPEISANRCPLWLRFTLQGGDLRPRALDSDVDSELALCNR